jgi:branched-subunit amino acid transport protein
MADRLTLDHDEPSLLLLIVDALAFWFRNQAVFWLVALPIAGLGAAIAFVLDRDQQFAGLRNHWGWDFLFALIYAMFLDRWMKITLLDGASPCEEVDNLRRSIISVRFLVFAACFLLLAMIMSMVRLEGITDTLLGWRFPRAVAAIFGMILTWLPHLFFWTTLFALIALMLPSLSAAEPTSISEARTLGRPVRAPLFRLIFGGALLSLSVFAATAFALELLPRKPWAAAAMAGAWRLGDCLLLAIVGYVLATIWRELTDWRQPEPEDHPFRHMKFRARGPA